MAVQPTFRRIRALIATGVCLVLATAGLTLATAPASAADRSDRSCQRTLPAGPSILGVSFAGSTYDVLVQVPDAPARKPLPLVVDLHGSNANGRVQAEISSLGEVGAANGFIVVNPTGAIAFPQTLPEGNWAWNVPGVPLTSGTYPPDGSRDDVAFLRAVVAAVDDAGCVDDRRVFATGFSGGGRMASALACEASDVFAAIAPVAGLRAGRPDPAALTGPVPGSCAPAEPVAVVTFHGTDDFVNPYGGNADPRWGYTVHRAAQEWATLNGCRKGPEATSVTAAITVYSWSVCKKQGDVILYEIAGGGHTWPGTEVDLSPLGATTQEISASQLLWDFFSSHRKRG